MPSDFLEKTLEDIIFNNRDKIHTRGYSEEWYDNTERQFTLPSGKRIDIFSWEIRDNVFYANVIELKKNTAMRDSFWQGMDYVEELAWHTIESFEDLKIKLIIVGNESYSHLSTAGIYGDNVRVYEYTYEWDGILFSPQEYSIEALYKDLQNRRLVDPSIDFFKKQGFAEKLKKSIPPTTTKE